MLVDIVEKESTVHLITSLEKLFDTHKINHNTFVTSALGNGRTRRADFTNIEKGVHGRGAGWARHVTWRTKGVKSSGRRLIPGGNRGKLQMNSNLYVRFITSPKVIKKTTGKIYSINDSPLKVPCRTSFPENVSCQIHSSTFKTFLWIFLGKIFASPPSKK